MCHQEYRSRPCVATLFIREGYMTHRESWWRINARYRWERKLVYTVKNMKLTRANALIRVHIQTWITTIESIDIQSLLQCAFSDAVPSVEWPYASLKMLHNILPSSTQNHNYNGPMSLSVHYKSMFCLEFANGSRLWDTRTSPIKNRTAKQKVDNANQYFFYKDVHAWGLWWEFKKN